MRCAAPFVILCAFVICAACGGPQLSPRVSKNGVLGGSEALFAEPDAAHLTGSNKISLLARGFLQRGKDVDPSFGYYVYLYFRDKGEVGQATRLSAANAFVQLFDGVEALKGLSLTHNQLALFVAPIAEDTTPTTGQELVADYDYDAADLLSKRLEAELPRVGILGSTSPLTSATKDQMFAVDLCGPAELVQSKVLGFKEMVRFDRNSSVDTRVLLEKVRALFRSIGSFALSPMSADSKAPSPCP
jgi:hypothetical protein